MPRKTSPRLPPLPSIRVMRTLQDAGRDLWLTPAQLTVARACGRVFYELTNLAWCCEDRFTTLDALTREPRP
jgi:hypothetical protein